MLYRMLKVLIKRLERLNILLKLLEFSRLMESLVKRLY